MDPTRYENAADAVYSSLAQEDHSSADAPLATPSPEDDTSRFDIDEAKMASDDDDSDSSGLFVSNGPDKYDEDFASFKSLSQSEKEALIKTDEFKAWRTWSAFHLGEWAQESWYSALRESRPELPAWPVIVIGPLKRTMDMWSSCVEKYGRDQLHLLGPEIASNPEVYAFYNQFTEFETLVNGMFILPSPGTLAFELALQSQIRKEALKPDTDDERLGQQGGTGQNYEGGDLMIINANEPNLKIRQVLFAMNMPHRLDWYSKLGPESEAHSRDLFERLKLWAFRKNEPLLRILTEAICSADTDTLFGDIEETYDDSKGSKCQVPHFLQDDEENGHPGTTNIPQIPDRSDYLDEYSSGKPNIQAASATATTGSLRATQGVRRQNDHSTNKTDPTKPQMDEVAAESKKKEKKKKNNKDSKRRRMERKARQKAAEKAAEKAALTTKDKTPSSAGSLEHGEIFKKPAEVVDITEEPADVSGEDATALEEDQIAGREVTSSEKADDAIAIEEEAISSDKAEVSREDATAIEEDQIAGREVTGSEKADDAISSEKANVSGEDATTVEEYQISGREATSPDKADITFQKNSTVNDAQIPEEENAESREMTSLQQLQSPEIGVPGGVDDILEAPHGLGVRVSTPLHAADVIDQESGNSTDGFEIAQSECNVSQGEATSREQMADITDDTDLIKDINTGRIPYKLPRVEPVLPLRGFTPKKDKAVSEASNTPDGMHVVRQQNVTETEGHAVCETHENGLKMGISEDESPEATSIIATARSPRGNSSAGSSPPPGLVANEPSSYGPSESGSTAESEESVIFIIPSSREFQIPTQLVPEPKPAGNLTVLNKRQQEPEPERATKAELCITGPSQTPEPRIRPPTDEWLNETGHMSSMPPNHHARWSLEDMAFGEARRHRNSEATYVVAQQDSAHLETTAPPGDNAANQEPGARPSTHGNGPLVVSSAMAPRTARAIPVTASATAAEALVWAQPAAPPMYVPDASHPTLAPPILAHPAHLDPSCVAMCPINPYYMGRLPPAPAPFGPGPNYLPPPIPYVDAQQPIFPPHPAVPPDINGYFAQPPRYFPRIAPPIRRFATMRRPDYLRHREIPSLLRDYQRLVGVLGEMGLFCDEPIQTLSRTVSWPLGQLVEGQGLPVPNTRHTDQ